MKKARINAISQNAVFEISKKIFFNPTPEIFETRERVRRSLPHNFSRRPALHLLHHRYCGFHFWPSQR